MEKFNSTNDYLKSFKFSETSEKQDIVPFKSVFDNGEVLKKISDILFDLSYDDRVKQNENWDLENKDKDIDERVEHILELCEDFDFNLGNISKIISKIISIKPIKWSDEKIGWGNGWENGFNEISKVLYGFLEKSFGSDNFVYNKNSGIGRSQNFSFKINESEKKVFYYYEDSYHPMTFESIQKYINKNLKVQDLVVVNISEGLLSDRYYNQFSNVFKDYDIKMVSSDNINGYLKGGIIVFEVVRSKNLKT